MITCTKCGHTQTPDDAKFCGKCGAKLTYITETSKEQPVESDHTEVLVADHDGIVTSVVGPSVAYPSSYGPSSVAGIAVRRGSQEATLLWSRIRTLTFHSRQEKNDSGKNVWRHTVEATLTDGKVVSAELTDDWNMAYMGGGGTGLLFGQTDLGETKIPFTKIHTLRVVTYAQGKKK